MRHATFSIAAVLAVLACASVHADAPAATGADAPYELDGVGQVLGRECGGGDTIKVTGSNNQVSLYGECASLEVVGSGNSVHADALQSVIVSGTGNQIFWKTGSAPKFSQTGTGNSLLQEGKEGE